MIKVVEEDAWAIKGQPFFMKNGPKAWQCALKILKRWWFGQKFMGCFLSFGVRCS